MARKYAHKIPFIVKINHNELLTFPNSFEQILFGSVEEAYDMGAAAVGAGAPGIGGRQRVRPCGRMNRRS